MSTRRSFVTSSVAGLLLLARATASRTLWAAGKFRFAIVVAKSSPVSDISIHDLKRAYKGAIVDVSGKRLVPLNLPSSSEHRIRFDQAVLGMDPETVSRYWVDRRIRGQSGPPKSLGTPDLVQGVVARLDGAIGYVHVSEVKADVKVLRVDGKAPTDGGYAVEF
jgi:hypothetical protein